MITAIVIFTGLFFILVISGLILESCYCPDHVVENVYHSGLISVVVAIILTMVYIIICINGAN